jgi:cellulose synthase/poly-beta-1,6-N-acetylglucosamine synthase-like glycosyltransferase
MDGAYMDKRMVIPGVWRRLPPLETDQHLDERTGASSLITPYANVASPLQVSVVIPTCGRIDFLRRCLQALAFQNLGSANYEIIIVDDRPSQATRDAVAEWVASITERQLAIVYVVNTGPHGPAAARNRGWQVARAPIVAFTDDDTVPAGDWLKNGLAAFVGEADAIWGQIQMPLPAVPTDYQWDAKLLETAEFVTANCFCRKQLLEELGGFDERFRMAWREDSDFYFRLLNCNATIIHAPQAVVVHPVRPEPWGVSVSQQKKILFDALLYKKHPLLYRQKIRSAPRWDYYLIVAALLTGTAALLFGNLLLASLAVAVWVLMTAWLCWKRLRHTARTWPHIAEMIITSALIPLLAVFWRIVGAVKFRAGLI